MKFLSKSGALENPVPEGARVEVVREEGALTRVRFGSLDAWLPAGTLRPLAR